MKILDPFFNRFVDIEKNRYANLEGIRALAIIMVFNVHLFGRFYKDGYYVEHDLLRNFLKVLHAGHTGVDLFFVLSGFLIFRSLGKVPNLGQFMFKRYHRLWPVVFVTGIALFKSMNNSVLTIFDNFSLLMFWTKEPVNYVNWTLTYEVYFYFFIGLWFFYLQKIKFFKANGIFLFGLLLILTFAIVPGHFIQEPYRFIGFFWGILLAKLHDHGFFLRGIGALIAKYGWVIAFVGIPILLTWWGVYALASPFPKSWPTVVTTVLFFMLIEALYFLLIASTNAPVAMPPPFGFMLFQKKVWFQICAALL